MDYFFISNGSSPIAPRTPSIVEIQHGGNNYTIQVQVLGTEETWETPSLLLACVKNTRGRAIFSQVLIHLFIAIVNLILYFFLWLNPIRFI